MPSKNLYKRYVIDSQYTVIEFQELDSTNDYAIALINNQEDIGTPLVIKARKQLKGKGRYGRAWLSVKDSLAMSYIVRKKLFPILTVLPAFTSLVTARTYIDLGVEENRILLKWPNDVLLDKKKSAGILIEIINDYLIIGLGVNMNCSPEIENIVTSSLKDVLAKDVNTDTFLQLWLQNFDELYDSLEREGEEKIFSLWMNMTYPLGAEITFTQSGEVIKGSFLGMNPEGHLILDYMSTEGYQEIKTFSSGEIVNMRTKE